MKAYVMTTGVLFALLTAAHVWRLFVEEQERTEPFFLGITALTALLGLWAWRLLRRKAA